MSKMLTIIAVLVTISTSANASPVSDFLDGLFGGHSPQQQRGKSRHARSSNASYSDGWTAYYGGHDVRGSSMVASFYGHGERLSRHTASGAVFNPRAMTAAHKTLPFGTVLRVCHRGCVNVTVNDRGPFVRGRSLDLSYGAARAIGMGSTSRVSVARVR